LAGLLVGAGGYGLFVLRKQPLDLVADPTAWRAVSAPFIEKGKRELTGCSERGRVSLRLLKRNRNDTTRDFERADRGDVIVVGDEPGENRLEIVQPLQVVRVD